jgi:multidrug efflux system membrane fusion protein
MENTNNELSPNGQATGKRRLKISRSLLTSLVVAFAIIGWVASGVISGGSDAVETAKAIGVPENGPGAFTVVARQIKAQPFANKVSLQARSEAEKRVTLAAETNGTISALPVDKGAFVQAGQTICQIDVGARAAQLEEARALRNVRKIEYQAARKLHDKGHSSKSQLAASRAAYDAAIAAVKLRKVELDRTRIKAPFDGILDTQPLRVGDFLSVGRPCGMLIDKDPLLIVAYLSENQVNDITIGAGATARLATGETIDGLVRYVAESPDAVTRTFRVEVEVENRDLRLRDGVSAQLDITAQSVMASKIPQDILALNEAGQIGVRVIEDGIVAFRPVRVLTDDRLGAYVTGLRPLETVITIGSEFTRAGARIAYQLEADDAGMARAPAAPAQTGGLVNPASDRGAY